MGKVYLSMESVTVIEEILSKGDRAEIIPVKNGVRIMRIKRDEANRKISDREISDLLKKMADHTKEYESRL